MICRRCGLNLFTASGTAEAAKLRKHEATCTGKPKVAPKPTLKPKTP